MSPGVGPLEQGAQQIQNMHQEGRVDDTDDSLVNALLRRG